MPVEDNNFGGSLGLDFREWWRHMQQKNIDCWYFIKTQTYDKLFTKALTSLIHSARL